ncbi:Microcystin-dependent protein [Mucilaginibacter mallensis]|uniref:Microcystin-dependent protein n=1 Tax=Mucilaginibacter mallensis TaxID=652787 RepID=A0A1H1YQ99_MUCMA|nr:tail fiber protein [Mucilaginibacter mallensis]SDT23512.1 Microcystin-dependent protein [Mucilaginibacter mallensis]
MNPLLAMIFAFGSNFAPQGFLFCSGQLLSISSNAAVFSLLGTTYGGNGINTFALPDLRGRAPIGQGQGPGLSNYVLGQASGTENTSILISNLPSHTHTLNVNNGTGTTGIPGTTTYLSKGPVTGSGPTAEVGKIYTTTAPNTTLAGNAIGLTGSNIPISILQPYLAVSYIIAMFGIFPSRN